MTPEHKFNLDIWWILQEIKKDEFLAPKGEKVEFTIRGLLDQKKHNSKEISQNIPDIDTQRKLLNKLAEWKAVYGLEAVDDVFRGSDTWNPTIYQLSIKQPKFNEIYNKFESIFNIDENDQVLNNNEQPIIKTKTLELIARDIGELDTGTALIDFLTECGVDGNLIEYPQTKWRMVYDVLIMLARSSKIIDQEVLIKIIEESIHPAMHKGDYKKADEYKEKINNLLKFDNFEFKSNRLKRIVSKIDHGGGDEENDETEDVFNYDGGITTPYENTDLELFILKKIQLEHKRRDDSGFFAKELSFNNDKLHDICMVINRLMEDKILYLSANTRPEYHNGEEGIEGKDGFINWGLVKKLDKNPETMNEENGCVIFDMEIIDELKLKGRIDIAIEEFMNDKIYTPLGYLMDKEDVYKILDGIEKETDPKKKSAIENALTPKNISHPYYKQRAIIIDELSKNNSKEILFQLNNFSDKKVEVLKTLLALEKENLLRITELRSNPVYDYNKGCFVGAWKEKDEPVAKIYTLKTKENKQEPMLLKIVEMPELKIQGVGNQREIDDISKINLSDNNISFDDDKAKIIIGKKECQLPAYKNEHYFCRAIFQHPVDEFVDWSIIFENMDKTLNSGNKKDSTKDKRSIQDTMYAINKRIKGVVNTDDDLFTWKDKSVKRNY